MRIKSLRILKLFLIVLVFSSKSTFAQNDFQQNLTEIIEKSLTELKGIPSISIVVVKNSDVVYLESFGLSDVENNVTATIHTPYYIASTTKSFTGTLAQILHNDSVIDLDLPITNYKPIRDFENKEVFKDLTIRNLLTHTSGLSNGYLVWRNATSGEYTTEQLIEILEHYTSSLDNDNSFKYDNLGYNIFDLILQKEFNLDWKVLLEQKLFKPLKMDNTTAIYSKVVDNSWLVTKPYLTLGNANAPTIANSKKDEKTMQAAGGLYTSIENVSHWLMFNIGEGVYNDERFYSDTTLANIHQSYVEVDDKGTIFDETGYGLGWHNALFNGEKVLYHNGGFVGNSARIAFMPEEKVGIAVFINESLFGDNIADILTAYTFNYFIDKNEPINSYVKEIEALKERVVRMNESYAKFLSERKSRPSSLTLILSEYEGKYLNAGYGTFTINIKDSKLYAQMGLLRSEVYYTFDENTVEVEFSSPGSGTQMEFVLERNKIKSLKHKGLDFIKQ